LPLHRIEVNADLPQHLRKWNAATKQQQGSNDSEEFTEIPHHMVAIMQTLAWPKPAPRPHEEKKTGKQNAETGNLPGSGLTPTRFAYEANVNTRVCRTLAR